MNSSDINRTKKLPLFKQYYTPTHKFTYSKIPDSKRNINIKSIKYINTKYSQNFNDKNIAIRDLLEKNIYYNKNDQIKYPNIENYNV
jgi:hypothetical protein